ncbi:MAG: queuosine precursor transporter [Candidatus Peribacteraceae bacterium]|nr:queuosine precursor transporter [Candidatus Peribacteraceae bacterium]
MEHPTPAAPRVTFDRPLLIAFTIYLTALFASNTVGIKIMPFLFGTHLSTAIFAFPVVFLMTDVVGEVYGKAHARAFVRMGFYSILLFLFFNYLSNILPVSPDFRTPDEYKAIFGLSFRFTLASLVAFIVGEYQDVYTFFFIRGKIGSRFFWLRSLLSNMWGQMFDTVIWYAIALGGYYPTDVLIRLMIPWWLFKVAMGLLYTPLSYGGIALLRRAGENKA